MYDYRIRLWYLSGGMTKFGSKDFESSNNWRLDIKNAIYHASEGQVTCLNPNDHWSMRSDAETFTNKEVMDLDIYKLRKSELVIYNNNDPYSRGSMIEIGIAYQLGIPIIVLNEDENEMHPWIEEMSVKVFMDREDMLSYLTEHYICID